MYHATKKEREAHDVATIRLAQAAGELQRTNAGDGANVQAAIHNVQAAMDALGYRVTFTPHRNRAA